MSKCRSVYKRTASEMFVVSATVSKEPVISSYARSQSSLSCCSNIHTLTEVSKIEKLSHKKCSQQCTGTFLGDLRSLVRFVSFWKKQAKLE